MKHDKKRLAIVLMMIMVFTGGCASKGGADNIGNGSGDTAVTAYPSAYERGLEVIGLLNEIVNSDEYASLYGVDSDVILEIISKIRQGDYTTPGEVYQLTVSKDVMDTVYALSGVDKSGLSESLLDYLNQRLYAGSINQMNSTYGVSYLATAAAFMAEKIFVCDEITEDMMYVYTFEQGFPVVVIYIKGEDGAVRAQGSFILNEELIGASKEDMEAAFRNTYFLTDCGLQSIERE